MFAEATSTPPLDQRCLVIVFNVKRDEPANNLTNTASPGSERSRHVWLPGCEWEANLQAKRGSYEAYGERSAASFNNRVVEKQESPVNPNRV